jgi:hypothetical protein
VPPGKWLIVRLWRAGHKGFFRELQFVGFAEERATLLLEAYSKCAGEPVAM